MVLVERDTHLAALREYAAEARAGAGRLVLVAGEAGVGKTALVEEAQTRIPAAWAWGACDPLSTPRPLGPLRDLAPRLDGRLAALCRQGAPRDELFQAALDALSAPGELRVVVIEDAHWADEATLDLLRFLGRRVQDASAVLIVTYRDDEPGARLVDVLGQLAAARATRRIDLPRLSRRAVAELAGERADPDQLFAATGGNPFFVAEMLRAGADGALPASVRDLVLARAAVLGPAARDVLDCAALIGVRVDADVLAAATGADSAAVDAAIGCGLLQADARGSAFAHDLTRRAIDAAILPHRRHALHAGILRALRATGVEDATRLAVHAVAAGDAEATLAFSRRAGDEAVALGSHREATAHFEHAARHRDRLPPAQRAELLDALGSEASLVDRGDTAVEALDEAARLWGGLGEAHREGASLTRLSLALLRDGRGDRATEIAQRAVELLEPLGDSPELARALVALAGDRMVRGRDAESVVLAQRAAAMGELLGSPAVISDALNTMASAMTSLGGDWEPLMRRALAVARDAGAHRQAGRAATNLHAALVEEFRLDEADAVFRDGAAYCESHDVLTYAWCLRGEQSRALELRGAWDAALDHAEGVLATAPTAMNRFMSLTVAGRIRARRGEARAMGMLESASGIAASSGQPECIVDVALSFAETQWLEGDEESSRDTLSHAVAHAADVPPALRSSVAVWARRMGAGPVPGPVIVPAAAELEGRAADAAREWEARGCPYAAALVLAFAPEPDLMREAVGRLEDLGAVAASDAVRRRMRELGYRGVPRGARAATRAHPAGLTPREHEVLVLLCESLSNEQIARRLVLSTRTVDHHVSAVLAKLGVESRARAAHTARAAGLVPTA